MRRRSESGFAMLFVLMMAAAVAITMYMALPRAAFESQREKEQTLIDRGSQYKRAIQLYVRQNKRWPAKIEDLESTNGKRYLRKRYVDPMTGKDEWRPVHVGPNGVLTDSLVKPLSKEKESTYSNNFITELGGVTSDQGAAPGTVNPGMRKRPSDSTPSGPPDGNQTVAGANPPDGSGGILGQPGQPGQPLSPQGTLPNTGQAASSGLPQQLRGNPNAGVYPGPPVNSQTGGISILGGVGGSGYSTAPGANGQAPVQGGLQSTLQGQGTGGLPGQPGQPGGANGAPSSAAQLIQGLLTSPRPGGAPGTPIGSAVGGVQGGGIAGFASKFEGEAIKVYNDQTEYQKWEFVYDMSKDAMITGGQQAIPQPAGPNTPNGQGSASGTFGQNSAAGTPANGSGTGTTSTPVVH